VFFDVRVNIILSMRRKMLLLIVLMVALAACAPTAEFSDADGRPTVPAAVQPTETALPPVAATVTGAVAVTSTPATEAIPTQTKSTETPAASPTATPPVVATAAVTYGRTDEGAYFHGAPDAPVTLIDYSDFL
jgi:hypothetical protein